MERSIILEAAVIQAAQELGKGAGEDMYWHTQPNSYNGKRMEYHRVIADEKVNAVRVLIEAAAEAHDIDWFKENVKKQARAHFLRAARSRVSTLRKKWRRYGDGS